ncbi:integumentary mucin C.1-like isoform X1 [Mobula hypostoma]|uniref:integumentary mucin C.1-like isoform X1 n=1 Tax=Mobula hypostoma TaxID=723540 RepID=UPI002FC350C9
MSGRMKVLARGRQMLLALLLNVCLFPADSHGWPDNGTSVTPTIGTELTTGWPDNGTSVTFTNGTEPLTGMPENGTLVTPTNETDDSTAWPDNGTSVTPTNGTEPTPGWPDNGTSVTPTNGAEPTTDPQVTEPSRTTRSAPDPEVENQPQFPNFKDADLAAKRFYYDYNSLRVWGLVMAAVFFLMGIFILIVGGVSFPRCRRCRVRKGRTYNVVQPSQNPVQETRKASEMTLLDSGITAV